MELAEAIEGARSLGLYELLRFRLIRELIVANPLAGAEWSAPPGMGIAWEVLSAQMLIATSAVVGNRFPGVALRDPDNAIVNVVPPQGAIAASVSTSVRFWPGLGTNNGNAGAVASMPTPPLIVPGGWSIGSTTPGMDVADQYSLIKLQIREWSATSVRTALDWLEDHYR